MSNKLNESDPSQPKRICTNRGYENRIKQMIFESESDEDFEFSDSGSDYFCDACPEKPSLCQQPCFNDFHSRINI